MEPLFNVAISDKKKKNKVDREEEVVLLIGTQAFFFSEIRKLLLPGDGGEGHGIGRTPLAETL